MLLSVLLKQMPFPNKYNLIDEKPFDYLALIASDIDQPNCVFLDTERYCPTIADSVSMVLTTKELVPILSNKHYGLCVVDKPRELFFELHNYLSSSTNYSRTEFKTIIGDGCRISPLSSISEYNVAIGNNVTIEEFASIKKDVTIGDNSIICAGTVIGGDGFEFKRTDNSILKVIHAGGVIIGKNVEIQYNSCVDKGVYPWDNTIIGDNCKVDNLVHIAHAVKIGNNVMVVANSGIGGRTEIGAGTWIGFGATVTNGIKVGQNARVNIGSVVTKPVSDGGSVTGNFAIEHQRFLANLKKSICNID